MAAQILIAGGGIGGLAAAGALARRGHQIEVLEQAHAFREIGAGVQLGPNVTRRLKSLGLLDAVAAVAARPRAVAVLSAESGRELARMPLASEVEGKYGSPYLCAHRGDLHGVLLTAAQRAGVALSIDTRITQVVTRNETVCVAASGSRAWEGDGLIGADGLWSRVREHVVEGAARPRAIGHVAWRALIPRGDVPKAFRSEDVRAWLGERLHVVGYPVRGGDWLNLVVIAQANAPGPGPQDTADWDQSASRQALLRAIGDRCGGVLPLIEAMPHWRAWVLHDRPSLTSAGDMTRERVTLLGDAAHPMLPYLAQGAGMAIEDAEELAKCLGEGSKADVPVAFAKYAQARWQRNAKVQARASRNGRIFHAYGPVRFGRDMALRVLGAQLLDVPWLYAG